MQSIEVEMRPSDSDDDATNLVRQQERSGAPVSRRTVFAIVALVAVVGVVAVGIYVAETRAARAFSVPEKFSASFVATDKYDSTKSWTGGVHKVEDANGDWQFTGAAQLETHAQKSTYTYTQGNVYTVVTDSDNVVQGRTCMNSEAVPVVADLKAALKNSVSLQHVALATTEVAACGDQPKFLVTYEGSTYVMCWNQAAGTATVITAQHEINLFDITTSPAADTPYTVPTEDNGTPMQCEASARRLGGGGGGGGGGTCGSSFPSCDTEMMMRRLETVTPNESGRKLLLGVGDQWYLPPKFGPSGVTCLFVHGAGVQGGSGVSGSFTDYWGNIHGMLQAHGRCNQIKFVRTDTLNAWDTGSAEHAFCSAAVNTINNAVSQTVIFTHGDANLVVGRAFMSGRCSRAAGVRWVELQSARNMAQVADWAGVLCPVYSMVANYPTYNQLQADLHLCKATNDEITPAYAAMKGDYAAITSSLASYIVSNVDASSCGAYSFGLAGSSYLYILDNPIIPPTPSAKVWSRCWSPSTPRSTSPKSTNYYGQFNYLDATCRNGDGVYGQDRMPCSFIVNMVDKFVSSAGRVA